MVRTQPQVDGCARGLRPFVLADRSSLSATRGAGQGPRSWLPAAAAIGSRNDFQQMSVRVLGIDAPSAVVTVDRVRLMLPRIRPMRKTVLLDAGENLVELLLSDKERIVLGPDLAFLVHEIDVHTICRGDNLKRTPFLWRREA